MTIRPPVEYQLDPLTTARTVMTIALCAVVLDAIGVAAPNPSVDDSPIEFSIPDWATEARWYEIDLPRFHNGDPSNDLPGTIPWSPDGPPSIAAGGNLGESPRRHFGGDLTGLQKRLPYLKQLGVNTLYLRSVFHGATDTPPRPTDMRHIDDVLGVYGARKNFAVDKLAIDQWTRTASDQLFFDFLKNAHEQGFRVIVRFDTGFRRRRGNMRGHQDLTTSHYVSAVAKKWSDPNGDGDPSDGVDGWVISPESGERDGGASTFTKTVREVNPNALIVSRGPISRDVAELNIPTFSESILTSFAITFHPSARIAPRVRRLFPSPDGRPPNLTGLPAPGIPLALPTLKRGVTHCQTSSDVNAVPEAEAYERYRLVMWIQYFLPGAPVTLFGNEVGMYGGESNAKSAPMWWTDLEAPYSTSPHFRHDLLGLFEWLNQLRADSVALSRGSFRPIALNEADRVLAFTRVAADDELTLALNYGQTRQTARLNLGAPGQNVLTFSPRWDDTTVTMTGAVVPCDGDGYVNVDIEPMSGVILRVQRSNTEP